MVLDVLGVRAGGRFKAHKARADVLEGRLGQVRVVLAKPRTYMNESGGPVAALRGFFNVPVEQIVVVHDELDVGFGEVRVKHGGGDNGHNGLRSITKSLATREYLRVRLGIGRPPGRMEPSAFVLKDFSAAEYKSLEALVERAASAVESLIQHGVAPTQNEFH
jgi:PTH1 family peptidyl-tRNA hydrolase